MKVIRDYRAARVVVAAALLILFQDLLRTILEHQRFARSIACTDQAIRSDAGRYMDGHCIEHADLGDYTRLSAWASSLVELHWTKLVPVATAYWWF